MSELIERRQRIVCVLIEFREFCNAHVNNTNVFFYELVYIINLKKIHKKKNVNIQIGIQMHQINKIQLMQI